MYKLLKIIFFGFLFSYVFSVTVTNIESTNAILGENSTFILTVQDYDLSLNDYFTLGDYYENSLIFLDCEQINDTTLNCEANLNINDLQNLNNLTKTLYVNRESTNLTVTINKPSTLKLLYFPEIKFNSYFESSFYLEVNYNELYNSNISIKFGDISITNCEKSEIYNDINCKHIFSENYNEKTLNLIFNEVESNYFVTILAPKEFSQINYLNKDIYYVSSSIQEIYFGVDSSYKINEHKIVLLTEHENTTNVTLSCSYNNYEIYNSNCSVILNYSDVYYVFVDDKFNHQKLFVYTKPIAISEIKDIKPNNLLISSLETTFTLEVDYLINLKNAVFSLIDDTFYDNKIYLKKCSKLEDSINKITCVGNVTKVGDYDVYLNGVKQSLKVIALNQFFTKVLYVRPNAYPFISEMIEILFILKFDSKNALTSSKKYYNKRN